MSCHEGVSCDNCLKSNFSGKRFKCLICYDYDLCEYCHSLSVATSRHQASHPMQCILTRNEFTKYYAGESITPESPPSFVCPFCGKLGFTESLLQEHVTKEHEDVNKEVLDLSLMCSVSGNLSAPLLIGGTIRGRGIVSPSKPPHRKCRGLAFPVVPSISDICPVCAALPSGEPNLVTGDLAHHLSLEHRTSRDNEDGSSGRHIRRMFYPGRGIRTRNHRSMHFSGGAAISSSSLLSNNNSSSIRDSMDPITELLSQLSGVRRNDPQLQHNVATASQLQELQAQLQLERQRAAEIRQQLERFPNKLPPSGGATAPSSNARTYLEVASSGQSSKVATHSNKKATNSDSEDDKYLLSNMDNFNLTATELQKQEDDDVTRSHFVQELLLSMLSGAEEVASEPSMGDGGDRAVPIECGFYSSVNSRPKPSDDGTSSGREESKSPMRERSDSCGEYPGRNRTSGKEGTPGKDHSKKHRQTASHSEHPEEWLYENAHGEKSGEEDDRAPSPTPLQEHGRILQARVYAPGGVRIRGFQESAPIAANYGREDMGAGSVSKHAH